MRVCAYGICILHVRVRAVYIACARA